MSEFITGQGARPLILEMLLLAKYKVVKEMDTEGISVNSLFSEN